MERVELLTVRDRIQLSRVELTIMPDIQVPLRQWTNLEEKVTMVTPTREGFEIVIQFNIAHFNIRDPGTLNDMCGCGRESRVVP